MDTTFSEDGKEEGEEVTSDSEVDVPRGEAALPKVSCFPPLILLYSI